MSLERLVEIVESRQVQSSYIAAYFSRLQLEAEVVYSFTTLNDILDYVQGVGEKQIPKNVKKLLLVTFQAQISSVVRILDESGISKLFSSEEVYKVFTEISFSENKSFQEEEMRVIQRARDIAERVTERKLRNPSIPNEAWDVFWNRADRGKTLMLNAIQRSLESNESFSFYQFLSPAVLSMKTDFFDLVPFSPFKWRKFSLTCLGGVVGLANLSGASLPLAAGDLPSLATILASVAPMLSVIINAYASQVQS